jgi:hypothetical protein
MFIEGEIPNVVTTNGNNGNGGFMNGDGWWAIILFALIFGYGRNGFGGFGGGYGNGGVGENYVLATDFATIERKLDGVNNGLCDGFYAQNTNMLNGFANVQQTLCQGFSGVNATINNGFAGVNNAICTLGYQNQAGFNSIANQISSCCCDISRQISDCCCDLKTMNLENRYLNEKQTCDIVNAINAGNQRLVDIYTNDKIEALRSENAVLRGQISDDRQADRIINKLSPCPTPAYVVPNPNCCYDYNVVRNNGCGCC